MADTVTLASAKPEKSSLIRVVFSRFPVLDTKSSLIDRSLSHEVLISLPAWLVLCNLLANRQRIWKTWLTRFGAFLGWSLTMEIVCEGRVFILWRVYLFTLQVKKSAKYIQRRGQKKFLVRSMRRQTSAKGSRQKKVSACSQPCLSTRMPFSR